MDQFSKNKSKKILDTIFEILGVLHLFATRY